MDGAEDEYGPRLEKQVEEFRHLQSRSQRFIQVLIAALAVVFVFARREWINFFLNSSVPDGSLVIKCSSGGTVGSLSQTFAIINGGMLFWLVLLGLACVSLSGIWSARVSFLDTPTYRPSMAGTQLADNAKRIRTARRFLRIGVYSLVLGMFLLVLAAIGYWAFYYEAGYYILYFDVAVILVSGYLSIRLFPGLTRYSISDETFGEIMAAGHLITGYIAIVVLGFVLTVTIASVRAIATWARIQFLC